MARPRAQAYTTFFCRQNEPSYIKSLKLEILAAVADADNAHAIITELSEYVGDIDAQLAREAVHAVGRIALDVRAPGRCAAAAGLPCRGAAGCSPGPFPTRVHKRDYIEQMKRADRGLTSSNCMSRKAWCLRLGTSPGHSMDVRCAAPVLSAQEGGILQAPGPRAGARCGGRRRAAAGVPGHRQALCDSRGGHPGAARLT